MNGYILDTSAYIKAIRSGNTRLLEADSFIKSDNELITVYLSVVVLHELILGSVNVQLRKIVYSMTAQFENTDCIIDINRIDWINAAEVIRQVGQKYSFEQIKKSRLTNDALIAVSCARRGLMLFTDNINDFERISEFCSLKFYHSGDLIHSL